MVNRFTSLLLMLAASLSAAEFQNGQAARAVIGQPSFSAREAGITAHALTFYRGRLYAAEIGNRVSTFDIGRVFSPKDGAPESDAACAVCGFTPSATLNQAVMEGVAATAAFGRVVVAADTANHRVSIWRGPSLNSSGQKPDVILGRNTSALMPVSASSLSEPVSVAFDGKRLFVGDAALHRVLIWNSLPVSDDQPADVVLGQTDFLSAANNDNVGANTLRNPAALASDGVNLYVADKTDRRILVFTPGDFALSGDAVVGSASLLPGAFAPGALVTVRANSLSEFAEAAPDSGAALPQKLAGVQVLLNGVPLPLLGVAQDEVQVQLPYDFGSASGGSLYVKSERLNGPVAASNAVAVRFTSGSPGIFAFGGKEPRSGMLIHTSEIGGSEPGAPITSESPARPGEIITVWASGLGSVSGEVMAGVPCGTPDAKVAARVNAKVNGELAEVISAILPEGSVGVYEVRLVLPSDLPAGANATLLLAQNGNVSNAVTFAVQASGK